jgi:hypothetical protein
MLHRGVAMDFMPSSTVPTFSKMLVMFMATQPDMAWICQVSGRDMATTPTPISCPWTTARMAVAPIDTTMAAFMVLSTRVNRVMARNWR